MDQPRLWATIVVLGVLAGCKKSPSSDGVALHPLVLPGAELSFPEGAIESHAEAFAAGSVKLREPPLLLRWTASPVAITTAQLDAIMRAAAGPDAQPVHRPMKVAGLDGDSLTLDMHGHHNRMVTWWCPQDERQFTLAASAENGGDALVDRILATARCDLQPRSERPRASYPIFEPPPGFARRENGGVLKYEKDDEVFLFNAGTPRGSYDNHTPETRDAMVHAWQKGIGSELTRATDIVVNVGLGQPHWIISASGTNHGHDVDITISSWNCKDRDLAFQCLYMGPTGGGTAGVQALLAARCP